MSLQAKEFTAATFGIRASDAHVVHQSQSVIEQCVFTGRLSIRVIAIE
jgi:hypothetical protein